MKVVSQYMASVHEHELYPDKYICHQKHGNQIEIEEESTGTRHSVLTFSTNDVLGLTHCDSVRAAAVEAIHRYGTSNSSCSTLSGRIDLHRQLEEEISQFKELPHTQLFLNAWMAMQGLLDSFCHLAIPVPGFQHTRQTLILTDTMNHACIVSAVANADNRSGRMFVDTPTVRVKPYRHCDAESLRRVLRRNARPGDRILVVSDSVFSMDGDIAPLPDMVDVLADYPDSVLVMDEAHASGAIGATGRGIFEHFGLTPDQVLQRGVHPVIMTTFSKFAASAGAAISSHSRELTQLLDTAPTSICTISIPPPTAAAALQSIRLVQQNPQWTAQLQEKTRYLRMLLQQADFETSGETNVVPIIMPKGCSAKGWGRHLMEQYGVWVSAVWFIAKPRLRITVNALHTEEEIERLVEALIGTRHALMESAVNETCREPV